MRTLQWIAILFVTLALVINYTRALFHGGTPQGHPWSGIAMAALLVSLFSTVREPDRPPALLTVAILTMLAASAWTVSEFNS